MPRQQALREQSLLRRPIPSQIRLIKTPPIFPHDEFPREQQANEQIREKLEEAQQAYLRVALGGRVRLCARDGG